MVMMQFSCTPIFEVHLATANDPRNSVIWNKLYQKIFLLSWNIFFSPRIMLKHCHCRQHCLPPRILCKVWYICRQSTPQRLDTFLSVSRILRSCSGPRVSATIFRDFLLDPKSKTPCQMACRSTRVALLLPCGEEKLRELEITQQIFWVFLRFFKNF